MMLVIVISFSLIFSTLFALRNGNQWIARKAFKDDVLGETFKTASKNWHRYQLFIQIISFGLLAYAVEDIWAGLLGAAIFWLVFDGTLNIVFFKKNVFYVGAESPLDIFLGKFKDSNLVVGIVKVSILLVSLVLYFFNHLIF